MPRRGKPVTAHVFWSLLCSQVVCVCGAPQSASSRYKSLRPERALLVQGTESLVHMQYGWIIEQGAGP